MVQWLLPAITRKAGAKVQKTFHSTKEISYFFAQRNVFQENMFVFYKKMTIFARVTE
jgi:hypothetical protein